MSTSSAAATPGGPRIFLSYEFAHDAERAEVVRDAWSALGGGVERESVDPADELSIRRWIDGAITAASVTVVLAGSHTGLSRWVRYEIRRSRALGNGLFGVDVSGIADRLGRTSKCGARLPAGYPFYDWVADNGADNLRSWVERAVESPRAMRRGEASQATGGGGFR